MFLIDTLDLQSLPIKLGPCIQVLCILHVYILHVYILLTATLLHKYINSAKKSISETYNLVINMNCRDTSNLVVSSNVNEKYLVISNGLNSVVD